MKRTIVRYVVVAALAVTTAGFVVDAQISGETAAGAQDHAQYLRQR